MEKPQHARVIDMHLIIDSQNILFLPCLIVVPLGEMADDDYLYGRPM